MKGSHRSDDGGFQKNVARWINAALRAHKKRAGENPAERNNAPWILFTLKGDDYAVNAKHVARTAILYEMTPYESAPEYCPGVVWDRDGMLRLVDLRALLGMESFLSALTKREEGLPMYFILDDVFRRGVIVDQILMIKYAGNDETIEVEELIPYASGRLRFKSDGRTAIIIRPDDFRLLEFDEKAARLNWKGRIDLRFYAETYEDDDE